MQDKSLKHRKKILIVDDDADMFNWFKVLEKDDERFEFHYLENELKIVEVINDIEPDMVFVDIYLNTISGKNIGEIIGLSSIFKIPIVYMSAQDVKVDDVRTQLISDQNFLKKPLDKKTVKDKIAKVLRL